MSPLSPSQTRRLNFIELHLSGIAGKTLPNNFSYYTEDPGRHGQLEYWNRLPAHLVLSPSVSILKIIAGPATVRNLSCTTCVFSVPLHRHFSASILEPQTIYIPFTPK